jgi:hypothetical protein
MREDLDERLVVARWLRRQPRRCVVDLPPERLADRKAGETRPPPSRGAHPGG